MPAKKDATQVDLSDVLCQRKLCETLTVREIQTFLEFTEPVNYKKGDIIADIAEVGEALFFIIHGKTALFSDNHGKEVEIGGLGEGELMGVMSFFDHEPRSVRIRAMSADTRLLRLSRSMYQRMRVEHPYIAVNLLEHAIMSIDHLLRRAGKDIASFNQYMYGSLMR